MRKSYDNFVDNMQQKLNKKIDKHISLSMNKNIGRDFRSKEFHRDGLMAFGALPIQHVVTDDFYTFGLPSGTSGTGVGP